MQLDKKSLLNVAAPQTCEELLNLNQTRMQQTLKNPFFSMLKDPSLENPQTRQMFLDTAQVFSNFFQEMLFIRQATCHDKKFQSVFYQHLQEEFGHDRLLAARKEKHEIKDPLLEATSSWFCQQMVVLDNIEKAALIHLTLEMGGYYYHSWAKDKLNPHVQSNYYDLHSENDEEHAAMVIALLQNEKPETYTRLYQIVEQGWQMIDAMTGRIAFLAKNTNLAYFENPKQRDLQTFLAKPLFSQWQNNVVAGRILPWDPIIAAICDWFCYQMLIRDRAEKSVISDLLLNDMIGNSLQKVIQSNFLAPSYLHGFLEKLLAFKQLSSDITETDKQFKLSASPQPNTLINFSWDLLEALSDRIFYLLNAPQTFTQEKSKA